MKVVICCLLALALGCSKAPEPTKPEPIQLYESALHVYRMELQTLEELESLGATKDITDKQQMRVDQAKALARKLETKAFE